MYIYIHIIYVHISTQICRYIHTQTPARTYTYADPYTSSSLRSVCVCVCVCVFV